MSERQYPYIGLNPHSGSAVFFSKPQIGFLVKVGENAQARGRKIGFFAQDWMEKQFNPLTDAEALPIALAAALHIEHLVVERFLGEKLGKSFGIPGAPEGCIAGLSMDGPFPFHIDKSGSMSGTSPEEEKVNMAARKRALVKGDLIIGSVHRTTGAFSTTAEPAPHTNFMSAQMEAERLAKADPQKKFVVLEVKGLASVPAPGVNWE